MSERPTPDEIAYEVHASRDDPLDVLYRLRAEGYVIVHPDDVAIRPLESMQTYEDGKRVGWNTCRRRIFGDDV